jgi:hypothetical protein
MIRYDSHFVNVLWKENSGNAPCSWQRDMPHGRRCGRFLRVFYN